MLKSWKRSPFRLIRWFRCFIFVGYGALLVHNCMLFQSTQSGTCKSVSSLIVCKCSNPNFGGLHLSPTKPGSWPWSSVSLVPKYGLVQALAKHSVYLLQLIPPEYLAMLYVAAGQPEQYSCLWKYNSNHDQRQYIFLHDKLNGAPLNQIMATKKCAMPLLFYIAYSLLRICRRRQLSNNTSKDLA